MILVPFFSVEHDNVHVSFPVGLDESSVADPYWHSLVERFVRHKPISLVGHMVASA